MTANCLNFLANYANFLTANPTPAVGAGKVSGSRPHPIMFSETNCAGAVWPPLAEEPVVGTPISNPNGNLFGSFYIPDGWAVSFTGPNDETLHLDASTSQELGVDANLYVFTDSSDSMLNQVSSVTLTPPSSVQTLAGFEGWKFKMCNNEISSVVGARHLQSWQMGSTECDAFMTQYCNSCRASPQDPPASQLSCQGDSQNPPPLTKECARCVCLPEQNCLRERFCVPGDTNPACQNDQAFAQFAPVSCFGENCSGEGYLFANMQDQRCNETLCEQVVNLVGQNIVVQGGSTLYCGNRNVPVTTTATPTPTPSDTGGEILPTYAWLLIGIGAFVLFLAVPIAVIVYLRAAGKLPIKSSGKFKATKSLGVTGVPNSAITSPIVA